jgi:hypothetical protein
MERSSIASAIDAHVETCVNCSTLLAQMRRVREGEERSKRSRVLVVGGIVALVVVAGLGTWFALRRAPETTPSGPPEVRLPSTALAAGKPDPTPEPVRLKPDTTPEPVRLKPDTTSESAAGRSVRLQPDRTVLKAEPTSAAETARVEKPAPTKDIPIIEGDVVLRGRDRRIVWRTRDRAIEHSIDGGVTWTLEHTADRPIRAGAFVDADVAWLGGENGLVLRRTKNGWFGTSAPAEGAITAVRASSPSKATVTLDDGRVFRTENGGVTWSAQ